jgi:hypothetical protein
MVSGQDHRPRIEDKAMHPTMMEALAAEHVRDMRVSAVKAERASEARRARGARRARRGTPASAGLFVPQPRQSAELSLDHRH